MFNLAVILRESAAARPDATRPAVRRREDDVRRAGQRCPTPSRRRCKARGPTRGPDRPAAAQHPPVPVPTSACSRPAAVVVPLNVLLKAPEVAYHLADCRARMLITWAGGLDEAAKGPPRPEWPRYTWSAS